MLFRSSFDTLTRMIYDEDKPEDVLKVDASEGDPNTGDDAYDMIRYGLMSRPLLSDALKQTHKWGTPEWAENEAKNMEKQAEEHFKRLNDEENGYF